MFIHPALQSLALWLPSHIQECSNDITFPKTCIAFFILKNYMHKLTPYLFPSAQSCKKGRKKIALINQYIPDPRLRNYSIKIIFGILHHLKFFQTQHFENKRLHYSLHLSRWKEMQLLKCCVWNKPTTTDTIRAYVINTYAREYSYSSIHS